MSEPLVVIDADVLGRRRTGDETYVRGLLGELAGTSDLRFAAVTRRKSSRRESSRSSSRLTAKSSEWRCTCRGCSGA